MEDKDTFIEVIPSTSISLNSFSANDGDKKIFEANVDIDAEISSLSHEIDEIATDKIPFSKTDIIFAVVSGIVGAAFDALAILGNSSKNIVGKTGDKIHESKALDHKGQPIDYQGGFDSEGNPILHGSGQHADASFAGGKHRGLTEGHDLFRRKEAIKQIQDGEFRDGAFINGKYVRVASTVNQKGTPYKPIPDYNEAKKAYHKHMWADFWSTSSLPIPGTSYVREYLTDENVDKILGLFVKIFKPFSGKLIPTKVYDSIRSTNAHDIRRFIQKSYENGLNLRSETDKGFAFAIPELTMQIYVWISYSVLPKKRNEPPYSNEAIEQHRHILLLVSHSIVAAVNTGIAIGCENPTHLNFATILRVFKLAFSCIKDEINFSNRVMSKVSLDSVRLRLLEQKTIIAFAEGYLETANYQSFCEDFVNDFNKYLSERDFNAGYLSLLIDEYQDTVVTSKTQRNECNCDLFEMVENIKIVIRPDDTLEKLVENSFVSDSKIENIKISELLN